MKISAQILALEMPERITVVNSRETSKRLTSSIEQFVNGSKNSRVVWWGLIAGAIILISGVSAWWWLRPRMATKPASAFVSPGISPSNVSSPPPNTQTDRSRFQKPGGTYEATDPRWEIVRAKDKIDRNWEWKMPINFYGRVVDENGHPIPAVKVDFSWTDLSQAGSSTSIVLSDPDGAFSLEGKTGRSLQVDVSKDGYYKPKNERLKSFDYAGFWEANYHGPDRTNPVVFRLLKKGQGEPLSAGEIRPIVPPDGTPVRFDLLNGALLSSDGQLEIAAVTNTEKYPPRLFNWQASIAVQDGGLLEHELEFPFEAPEEGYVPKIQFQMSADAPDWRRSIEKSYFVRFGTPPKYGRIRVRFNGASQKVSLHYAVNPNGSRNLESNIAEP